jgi:NAD(P)-dependent dehydrogenase (short-subunit alcohol dehydrogenase family)
MSEIDASAVLRPGLLDGIGVLVHPGRTGEDRWPFAEGVRDACARLGARVHDCGGDGELDERVAGLLERGAKIDLLVFDGAGLFADRLNGGVDPERALGECLQMAWDITRALVNLVLVNDREGRIIYLAPDATCGEYALGVRAGLENLARTLSIEWARRAITAVTVATGSHSGAGEVSALIAYLASPAGDYFSGCLFDLAATGR